MAFYGCDFTFNGVSASSMGLMLYSFGGNGQGDADFSVGEPVTDLVNQRHDALLYGLVQNEPLTFTLVFGEDPDEVDAGHFLTRQRINEIAAWLTGHSTWKELFIHQEDMATKNVSVVNETTIVTWTPIYHYKCLITDMKLLTDGSYPWAFSCTVTCDSPFAYMTESIVLSESYNTGSEYVSEDIDCPIGYNGYYYPKLEITPDAAGGTEFFVLNASDGNKGLMLPQIPTESGLVITADGQNQILTCNKGFNLYEHFNMHFLRLKRGTNTIKIKGHGLLKIICEFPVNIGA